MFRRRWRRSAEFAALHPLGRLGTPVEVAQAVLFLLDAPWITGTVLTVDGGVTLR
jgi:NAD(P)-dependent dehydrogenase (short-subunit alcohol dehydrogenase family)